LNYDVNINSTSLYFCPTIEKVGRLFFSIQHETPNIQNL